MGIQNMRRVVVTGMGLVTPLAGNVEDSWSRLLEGQSSAGQITRFDASDLSCRIACEVKRGDGSDGTFNPDEWISAKDQRRYDEFIILAMSAAGQAVLDSGWKPETDDDQYRTGVLIGSGIGGLPMIQDTTLLMQEKGPRRVSPFFIPGSLINLASGLVSIAHGCKGPNHSVVTACSTGAHSIGDAARFDRARRCRRHDCRWYAESALSAASAWQASLPARRFQPASTTTPEKRASRPYDRDRDGFRDG